jgi:multiple sugar transport system ATP-binding protein
MAADGVRVRGLQVRLGGNDILRGLDLEAREGEFLVLLGPSGCGKSTLLHAIAGLLEVRGGTVEIGGVDVTGTDPAERNIGMVFQSYALYPTMSVERNLSFGLRVRGTPRAEARERVARVARMLQLGPLLARRPAALSGGQRQRVAIGRALVRDARVFLFDEPLSNLDAQLRAELRRELKELHARLGATMIYVTHDQSEAMTLATRVAVLRGGEVQQVGAPQDVYARPANRFVAGFLGSPGMNFLEGVAAGQGGGLTFVAGQVRVDLASYACSGPAPAPGAALVLGIRPEHVRLRAGKGARVALVEPMGSQTHVWVEAPGGAPGQRLCAIEPGGSGLRPGDELALELEGAGVSLFTPEGNRW